MVSLLCKVDGKQPIDFDGEFKGEEEHKGQEAHHVIISYYSRNFEQKQETISELHKLLFFGDVVKLFEKNLFKLDKNRSCALEVTAHSHADGKFRDIEASV